MLNLEAVMISKTHVRLASEADVEFIIETIIEAEKSGTQTISYCHIFGLKEEEFRKILHNIIDEDYDGQEFCKSGYMVAEVDGQLAGAACGWIEGETGLESNIIKANLLHHFLQPEELQNATRWSGILEKLHIPREKNTLQLESIYVREGFRGKGIISMVLTEQMKRLRKIHPSVSKAQIILADSNKSALTAYSKLGFELFQKRSTQDVNVLRILPCDTKILLEKKL
jgi:GNAT superfamily N-acetyltransferase